MTFNDEINYLKTIVFMMLLFVSHNYAQSEFIIGADVSYLDQIERHNGVYKEKGIPKDALLILKDHGFTHIRLRLWHTPAVGVNDQNSTVTIAKRAKALGLKLLLDLHYSDTWADPGKQAKPAAWKDLAYNVLLESVYVYTKHVMQTMKNNNVYPELVQIGNETICGMLWNDGNVCGSDNNAQQWYQYGMLVKEAIRAVRETEPTIGSTKIMLHVDRGGDSASCRWFFDHVAIQQIPYDIIGLSYYPWWHGTFPLLDANIRALVQRYSKEVMIAETAYPWTLQGNDNENNIIGLENQLTAGYPATVTGQQKFLTDLSLLLKSIPDKKASGLFYWAPEDISAPGLGSVWENLALFDFSGEVLSSARIATSNSEYSIQLPKESVLLFNFPNPFNPSTTVSFSIPQAGLVTIKIFDLLGKEISTIAERSFNAGAHTVRFDAKGLSSGTYLCRLTNGANTAVQKIVLVK